MSIRELMNSSGTLFTRYTYDPYGRTTPAYSGSNTSTPPVDATFQYAGYYNHATSGLNFTQAGDGKSTGRPYKANTGTWLSRDPITEAGGINLYDYVVNNPVSLTDPLGECFCPIFDLAQGWREQGHTGWLYVSCSCKGKLNMWVIDEFDAPAAAAGCGGWLKADGFVVGGVTYKIDGSACVKIDCCQDQIRISTCINKIAQYFHGSKPPYPIAPGGFGGSPKEPKPGSPEPPIYKPHGHNR